MIATMVIGNKPIGKINLDTDNRKILSMDIKDKDSMNLNFPGILGKSFGYTSLEKIMQYYTNTEYENKSLLDILKDIKEHGFFSTLKPSLTINIDIIG